MKAGLEATLAAQVTVKGRGLVPDSGRLSATIAAEVKPIASFQITDSYLCLLPFGIGNFICKEHDLDLPAIVGSDFNWTSPKFVESELRV
jgi:hypothetical protein